MTRNKQPWSQLCHACAAQVPAGAHTCPACGAVVPTVHEDLRLANHPLVLEFRRNRRVVVTSALSLVAVLVVVTLFRIVYEWRRSTAPTFTEWMLNEGYYWMIAIVLISIGSHVAIYLIHRRFEKKWQHSENTPKLMSTDSNPPYIILSLGILIVIVASLFVAILITEVTTLEHQRATRELLPAIVASALGIVAGVILIILAFRKYRSYTPLSGGQITNSSDNE